MPSLYFLCYTIDNLAHDKFDNYMSVDIDRCDNRLISSPSFDVIVLKKRLRQLP
jgi:hypothetical protein